MVSKQPQPLFFFLKPPIMLLIYTALLAAGKVDDNTEVTIFDCIQWAGVGEQVASVDDV